MLYLNEDAVKVQIIKCQKKPSKMGKKCKMCKVKKAKLCPLGEAWEN
jgi:hypothetical protein